MNDTHSQVRQPRGAEEYVGSNAKFLHIKYGCLCEVSKTPVAGWNEHNIVDKETGVVTGTKWIKVYKFVEGWVNKLEWYTREFQGIEYMGWKLHMEAGGINYVLDLPLNNSATKTIMLSARNIDFNIPLEIRAWTDKEDGKLATWLKQNDQSVLQYYKKGDMKDCPEPVQKPAIGGKLKWNWEATDTFLWQQMQDVIAPHIDECARDRGFGMGAQATSTPDDTPGFSEPVGAAAADDDIPF